MPSECATLRPSATAWGPQHLSSARDRQSCGQTFIVTPTTSYPCCCKRNPATEESTPPDMPRTTRGRRAGAPELVDAGFKARDDSTTTRRVKLRVREGREQTRHSHWMSS